MDIVLPGRSETTPVTAASGGINIDVVTGQPIYPVVKHVVSTASTNPTLIKGSAGIFLGIVLSNTAASTRFVKLYDKATAPIPGTDIPKMAFGIPAVWSREIQTPPVKFTNGLYMTICAGAADADATNVALNDVVSDVYYM